MGWNIPKNIVTKEEAVNIINEMVVKYLTKKHCFNCNSKEWTKNQPMYTDNSGVAPDTSVIR
jgi:hypothetical protein